MLRTNVREISDSQNSFGDLTLEAEENIPSTMSQIPPASFHDAINWDELIQRDKVRQMG